MGKLYTIEYTIQYNVIQLIRTVYLYKFSLIISHSTPINKCREYEKTKKECSILKCFMMKGREEN